MDMSFVWFLLIGLAAGWLAGQIVKGSGQGLITDIIVGVIGAMLGGVLFGMFGLEAAGTLGEPRHGNCRCSGLAAAPAADQPIPPRVIRHGRVRRIAAAILPRTSQFPG